MMAFTRSLTAAVVWLDDRIPGGVACTGACGSAVTVCADEALAPSEPEGVGVTPGATPAGGGVVCVGTNLVCVGTVCGGVGGLVYVNMWLVELICEVCIPDLAIGEGANAAGRKSDAPLFIT